METIITKELEEKVLDELYKQEKFCEFVAQSSGTQNMNFKIAKAKFQGMSDLACELGCDIDRLKTVELKLANFIYTK